MNLETFKKCVGKPVTLELSSLTYRSGTITDFDDYGVVFATCDNSISDMIIAHGMISTN